MGHQHSSSVTEKFIVKHSQQTNIENARSEHRRLVFISFHGLYQTWQKCPPYLLYSALVILPLKSDWIHKPDQHNAEIQSSVMRNICQNKSQINEFMEFLKWKNAQGLVLWALDDIYIEPDVHSLVAPFWRSVSRKLTSLVDPITGQKYHALKSPEWWKTTYAAATKRSPQTKVRSVLTDLFFVKLQYDSMSEILSQSNPNSLHPICFYQESATAPVKATWSRSLFGLSKTEPISNAETLNDEGWWISSDYDPYDL